MSGVVMGLFSVYVVVTLAAWVATVIAFAVWLVVGLVREAAWRWRWRH